METPFWMVFVDGSRGPGLQHPSFESAMKEAERLSQQDLKRTCGLKTTSGYIAEVTTTPMEIAKEQDP